jgi:hypothetical protein
VTCCSEELGKDVCSSNRCEFSRTIADCARTPRGGFPVSGFLPSTPEVVKTRPVTTPIGMGSWCPMPGISRVRRLPPITISHCNWVPVLG